MPTYNLKYRKYGAPTLINVTDTTPEAAIKQQILTAAAGEEIMVSAVTVGTGPTGVSLQMMDAPGMPVAGPTGASK